MIDVMHVISGLGTGGAETMLVQLAVGLRERGLSQHVISLSKLDTCAAELRTAGIEVTVLDAAGPLSFAGALYSLAGVTRRWRPRILQGWMYHGNIAATICHYLCGGRARRKLFWNLRASNMDEARYGGIIRLSALLSRSPNLIIANSEAGAAFHRDRGFRARRLLVIDNGVDTDKFRSDAAARNDLRNSFGLGDAVVAIHVARVDPMKDHGNFLSALAMTPAVTGIMVGSGTEQLSLPTNAKALGPRADVAHLLAAGDIVVSSSAFGEGFSNVIAEGMSAGLIPIATDVGDARRIVGDTGMIVPPRDTKAMAQALAAVAAMSGDERRKKGELARNRIVSHFSLGQALDRYFELYAAPTQAG
jgi:glycosyltransferase involved in cell wall biosynthesis